MFFNLSLDSPILYITAPIEVRWQRAIRRRGKVGEENITLKDFVLGEQTINEINITYLVENMPTLFSLIIQHLPILKKTLCALQNNFLIFKAL